MSDRFFHHRHGLGIEIGRGLKFGLGVRHLDHFGFQRDGIAVGGGLLVRRFTILADEWTAASGELTPTMKLKRRVVEQRYQQEIESVYAQSEATTVT